MRRFEQRFRITGETRILDIGGTLYNWKFLAARPRITLVNIPRDVEHTTEDHISFVAGDGCRLPFRNNAFDVVFSNSVIEHVGGTVRQQAFAREVARVGASYYVQTPNRLFPVEQHLFTPLVHLLPGRWQRWLVHRFTVWAMIVRPTPDRWEFYIEHYLRDIHLLDTRAMRRLFPEAVIRKERFLGLSKSLIAEKLGRARENGQEARPSGAID